MGKTSVYKYAVRMRYINFSAAKFEEGIEPWHKHYGKPNVKNLEAWRQKFNESMLPGGVNAHLAANFSPIGTCWIVNQFTKEEVCRFVPPMFEIID